MTSENKLMTVDNIRSQVYIIRGQQVMLDYNLAEIYGYEVKRLNEQVKNNISRFPEDFMFQLTKLELEDLRSKNSTANLNPKSRTLPHAFTEQGIYMLATVLRGQLAEQQSIFIMRAFREMRHYIRENHQFATQEEMHLVSARVSEISVQVASMADRQKQTEKEVQGIQHSIDQINKNFVSEKDFKNFVIYRGQKFEADVEVVLFTENGHGRNGFLTKAVVDDFASQYPPFCIKPNMDCHDRWIIIDYGLEREAVFHCGASSKDAGKKLCAINKLENNALIHPVIDKLLKEPEKQIL